MAFVKIKVEYYNAAEKENFRLNYPNEYPLLENVARKTIEVPLEDFRTYFLFKHLSESAELLTFRYFFDNLETLWGTLKLYFRYDPQSGNYFAVQDGNEGNNEISEALGIGGGLALTGHVFLNTTQADWKKIPVLQTKDFDFIRLASTGDKYIIVECKGSIVSDNTRLTEISNHKGDIIAKKTDEPFKIKYPRNKYFYFGTITAADKTNKLIVRLVDPEINLDLIEPRKYKLLSRLYYYFQFIKLISRRSYLSLALANRIQEIQSLTSYTELDKIKLINSSFEKIVTSESFIKSKSHVQDQSIIGRSSITKSGELFFVGLEISTLKLLINQNHENILQYKVKETSTIKYKMTIILRAQERGISEFMKKNLPGIKARKGYYSLSRSIELSISSSGIILGHLNFQELINE